MLVIVMHNNKNYLEALKTLLSKESILNSTIIEEKNIGNRLIGNNENFISQTGTLRAAYDKALITAVRGEDQVLQVQKMIEEDTSLALLNLEDKGFVCTVPFSQLRSLTLETVNIEKDPEIDAKVCNLLRKENILLDLRSQDRREAIYELGEVLKTSQKISAFDGFMEKVLERE